jgi:uncharacterized protein (DUF2252 family)
MYRRVARAAVRLGFGHHHYGVVCLPSGHRSIRCMATNVIAHPDIEQRRAAGKEARRHTPRSSHWGWRPAEDRADPVALLDEQNQTREPDLVPVRHGRMMVSPFTFYRGSAKIMAADLKDTPTAGLTVQLCGDAHLSNFGLFGSPERRLLFDLNDFDETLPGPFEYDVERMAASFTIAARNNGFTAADTLAATTASVAAYREAMAEFAGMRTMDVWYARMDEDDVMAAVRGTVAEARKAGGRGKDGRKEAKAAEKAGKAAEKNRQRAHSRDSLQALAKLGEVVDGQTRIVSQPPFVVPKRELTATYGMSEQETDEMLHAQFHAHQATLRDDHRQLLERFRPVDFARKVVGVGSVGTRAFIALLQGRDADDVLFLQVKEATTSVLEDHLPKSRYRRHGERVVQGQRMMQAASDIYLGWTVGHDTDRHYYWRQLRDMKGSALVDAMAPVALTFYARLCGWTLARAHARSGDPVAISRYLGGDDRFDRSITDFSRRYADQNEQDYEAFVKAVRSGRLDAADDIE